MSELEGTGRERGLRAGWGEGAAQVLSPGSPAGTEDLLLSLEPEQLLHSLARGQAAPSHLNPKCASVLTTQSLVFGVLFHTEKAKAWREAQ